MMALFPKAATFISYSIFVQHFSWLSKFTLTYLFQYPLYNFIIGLQKETKKPEVNHIQLANIQTMPCYVSGKQQPENNRDQSPMKTEL